jgi:hypothetical protein
MPFFLNREGYTLRKTGDVPYLYVLRKAVYDFRLSVVHPLTYDDGTRLIQPDRHFVTDMGSVPLMLQPLIPKDRFLLSYIFHDSCYKHHGYWARSKHDGARWGFVPCQREDADLMLREMAHSEGGCVSNWVVWLGVRLGGCLSWGSPGQGQGGDRGVQSQGSHLKGGL